MMQEAVSIPEDVPAIEILDLTVWIQFRCYDVITIDYRGRGRNPYADLAQPLHARVLEHECIEQFMLRIDTFELHQSLS